MLSSLMAHCMYSLCHLQMQAIIHVMFTTSTSQKH
jgi:hypothetical protein